MFGCMDVLAVEQQNGITN